jgi:hypothetical protein
MRRSCTVFVFGARLLSSVQQCTLNSLFLKLGTAKGCEGFRETKMRNGGSVLLAALNLYVRIKLRLTTFYTNHSVTDSTQTIHRCFSPKLSGCEGTHSRSLPEDRGLNGHALRSSSKSKTHSGNFAFSRWTAGNPCSPWTGQSVYSPHTYRYA